MFSCDHLLRKPDGFEAIWLSGSTSKPTTLSLRNVQTEHIGLSTATPLFEHLDPCRHVAPLPLGVGAPHDPHVLLRHRPRISRARGPCPGAAERPAATAGRSDRRRCRLPSTSS